MSASTVPDDLRSALPTTAASSPQMLRIALVVGCLIAVSLVAVATTGSPGGSYLSDPELAFLLRGMAAIKAGLVLVAVALSIWRFAHPIDPRVAGIYLLATWLSAAAAMSIWQLTMIPMAAILFHVGELSFLVNAWFDRDAPVRLPGRNRTAG